MRAEEFGSRTLHIRAEEFGSRTLQYIYEQKCLDPELYSTYTSRRVLIPNSTYMSRIVGSQSFYSYTSGRVGSRNFYSNTSRSAGSQSFYLYTRKRDGARILQYICTRRRVWIMNSTYTSRSAGSQSFYSYTSGGV